MHDAEVAEWLANCTPQDVRSMLESVERSYRHPYGFSVHRLAMRHLLPWNLRVHFWPRPLAFYERLRQHRTESQLIHAHGWDLISVVVEGELEEREYDFDAEEGGQFTLYATNAVPGQSASVLRAVGQRLSIGRIKKRERRPETGAYLISAGAYHSTLPAKRSVSLVAAKQLPGQSSQVAVYRGAKNELVNGAPELPSAEFDSPRASTEDNWSSFVFFLRANQVLLVRTTDRPHQWHPIGGRRDDGDSSPMDTLIREVDEEVGAGIDPSMAVWIGSRAADVGSGTVCFWVVRDHDLVDPLPLPKEEIVEAQWWDASRATKLPMFSATAASLREILDPAARQFI
ncbi:NUDIX domain-containing protein [Phytohabitans sp. LJ34]|uniref:NUDIX domain-containing protein n=1 Tax=Phytohabitans sp. LJ34 TaxID=3452217 RepID=UPI003F88D3C1